MRVVVLATVLLASSSLYPSLAQEAAKPPIVAPQTLPTQPDQNSPQQRDQRAEWDRPRDDDREVGRDSRMHRGDSDHMGRDDREMGQDGRMHRERDDDRGGNRDRGRYADRDDRGNQGPDRAGRGPGYGEADNEDRPRRRVKVCIEYDGDEYCRYKGRKSNDF
jgi:hypothetical protein